MRDHSDLWEMWNSCLLVDLLDMRLNAAAAANGRADSEKNTAAGLSYEPHCDWSAAAPQLRLHVVPAGHAAI